MAFGVTAEGFVRKDLDTIKTEIETELRSRFGNNINLLPQAVWGQIIGVMADREAALWELGESVYDSQYPDTAFDAQLDDVVAITGIVRKAATFSTGSLFLFGTAATLVPAGTVVSVTGNPDARFVTDADVTLVAGTDEIQDVTFSATPDAGGFKLQYFDETTAIIAFGDGAAEVEAVLNALTNLSGVTVAGSFAAGFTITFAGDDGKQPQPALVVTDNTLTAAAVAVTTAVAETTPGVAQGTAAITAESTGEVAGPAFSITTIETPVGGLASVRNQEDADLGRALETDTELKIRREEELQKAGAATVEAIKAEVSSVDDVTAVIVFQNNTSIVDGEGRPPNSVDIVVEGGDEDEIATEIFETVAAGIETIGDITKIVVDSQGFSQTVKFSRPTEVDIWLEVDLTTNVLFPADGVGQAEANFLAFGNSLNIGEDVIVFPELLCALTGIQELGLDAIPGITNVAIRIGTAANPTLDANIPIDPREISNWDSARITVVEL